jgi:hypothetical protein
MVIRYRRGRTFAKGELYPDLAVGSTRGSAELEGADPGGVLRFGYVR